MQRVNEFAFYTLATYLHPITEWSGEMEYDQNWYHLYKTRQELEDITKLRPLYVCLNSANDLIGAINDIIPADISTAIGKQNQGTKLQPYMIYRLAETAKTLETVLSAEVGTLDTYFISQKGTYKTPDMIEHAEWMFPENIRVQLPDKAKKDIREAGRCLVLDTPTGAGFHILRAIESVMSMYYERVLGKAMPTRMRNWGIYIKRLRDSGKADAKVLEFLDHVRENYRNPIQHPDVFLTPDEVEVLLSVANGAIRQMIMAMPASPATATTTIGSLMGLLGSSGLVP